MLVGVASTAKKSKEARRSDGERMMLDEIK